MSSANRKSRWPIPLLVFGAICLVASFVTLPTIKALLKKQAELDANKWLKQAERDANSTWTEDDAVSWLHQHGFDKVHFGKAVSDQLEKPDEYYWSVIGSNQFENGAWTLRPYSVLVSFHFDTDPRFKGVESKTRPLNKEE